MLNKLVEALKLVALHIPGMHYTMAVPMAVDILTLADTIAQEKAEIAFENGHDEGYLKGRSYGLNLGKSESEREISNLKRELRDMKINLDRLSNAETHMLEVAKQKVSSIVTEDTIDTKIRNIQKLRAELPMLSLRQAKETVDEYTAKLREAMSVSKCPKGHDDCWCN